MTERTARWPAAVAGAALASATAPLGISIYLGAHRPVGMPDLDLAQVLFALRFVCLAAVGALIAARRPRHRIGWLLLGMGLVIGVVAMLVESGRRFYASEPDLGALMFLAGNQLLKILLLLVGLLLLTFPTGRLPSPRWRWVAGAMIVAVGFGMAGEVATPGRVMDFLVSAPPYNPFGAPALRLLAPLAGPGLMVFVVLMVAAAVSVVLRFRGADGELRLQLKWFTFAAVVFAAVAVADAVVETRSSRAWEDLPIVVLYTVATLALAGAIAIAILRHRLFDIDLVVSRTLAYGALAGIITAFYVGVVAGVGALLAAGSGSRLVLAVMATAGVAAAFQPMRSRLEKLANRLVYGDRAGPYEVLAEFTARLDGTQSSGGLLPTMAGMLAQGTGCDSATVWLCEHGTEVIAGSWPEGEVVTPHTATRSVAVSHAGVALGRLAVLRRSGQRLTPTEERLMDGLAMQAGLVLRNAGLQDALRQRLVELQASRRRLVAAQDEERRRLERDLHDGAQQHLISLRLKLGLAKAVARDRPAELEALVNEMQSEVGQAFDSLRALARGVYPPLLEAEGLRGALSARARQAPLPVDVRCGGERYPRDAEGAVYFCCSEALQNLVKHARARRGSIQIWRDEERLRFEVDDDGRGFQPGCSGSGSGLLNMRDRVETLGGEIDVSSKPGGGARVTGWLPLSTG